MSTEVEAPASHPTPSPSEAPRAAEASRTGPDAGERTSSEEVLPAPSGPLRSPETERPSLWRRIKMRRRDRVFIDGGSQEAMSARMTELEQRLEQTEGTLLAQLQHVEHRLDEVWEVEEQLSHLIEIGQKLDGLADGQQEVRETHDRLEHNLRLVAGFAGVLAIVVLTAVALSL
jgi:hypothetical protein